MIVNYTVDSDEGYSRDFDADPETVREEARKIVRDWGCSTGTPYEIWDREMDQLVGRYVWEGEGS